MNKTLLMMNLKVRNLFSEEQGQDLVEYALLIALVSLAAVVSVQNVATAITTVFNNISGQLGTA